MFYIYIFKKTLADDFNLNSRSQGNFSEVSILLFDIDFVNIVLFWETCYTFILSTVKFIWIYMYAEHKWRSFISNHIVVLRCSIKSTYNKTN